MTTLPISEVRVRFPHLSENFPESQLAHLPTANPGDYIEVVSSAGACYAGKIIKREAGGGFFVHLRAGAPLPNLPFSIPYSHIAYHAR